MAEVQKPLNSKISEACIGKKRLTIDQKAQIIALHCPPDGRKGKSAAKLGNMFGVTARQIRRICQQKDNILTAAKSGIDGAKRKMLRPDKLLKKIRISFLVHQGASYEV